MLRSVGAVIGGFVAMSVLVMIATMALAVALVPGGMDAMRDRAKAALIRLPPLYLGLNVLVSFAAAIVGGLVTAKIATHAPAAHILWLGCLLLVMGVVSAFAPGNDNQPMWYKSIIPMVGVAGVAVSALFVAGSG